ncbi:G1/S-specific cyclin-D2-like [Oppia nitens]|uniref:G1/S-specific cyclin-D2-like n=1 Tax=Oppia nitens TaxID=1686743 RepID=UPI0023DC798C|nr:G1/S-specific cyclin-D2-like [Oppia nitens]
MCRQSSNRTITMDLLCIEPNREPKAISDPVFLDDDRILKNLMITEERYIISSSYFKCFQTEIKPYMRKVVANWMLEVCEEERCQEEVFPLAMNILDRFLAIVKIRKSQLQLLGSVCLFLASKLRQTRPLSAEKLIVYTDKSITIDELMGWELLVLNRLKWDLAAITPNDFLNILIRRLHKWPKVSEVQKLIKKHAQTFIALCAADWTFSIFPPSMLAAASITTAIEGLTRLENNNVCYPIPMINQLHQITGLELDLLRECQLQIERIMSSHLSADIKSANSENYPQKFTDTRVNNIANTGPTTTEMVYPMKHQTYIDTDDCSLNNNNNEKSMAEVRDIHY